jgi:DGQHR domain-containing protein
MMPVNDTLKYAFSKELLQLAGTIGAKTDPVEDRVQQLFTSLPDPLLSEADVHDLLGGQVSADDVRTGIKSLVEKNVLESSDQTLRPLDEEGTPLYRLVNVPVTRLKLIAIESKLNDGSSRYQFTCDGRIIRSIARVDRLDALGETGNQRQEIRAHVEKIAEGINAGTQVPNSILLVLKESQITESAGEDTPESIIILRPLSEWISVNLPNEADVAVQNFRNVEIDFPFRRAAFDEEKSALLVDGQQRMAALSIVDIDDVPQFSLSVNAVKADTEQAKRVFQVANSTVKISTEFSRALLATMSDAPVYLRKERDKALAVKKLAFELPDSPFLNLAQHPGVKPKGPRPPIAYNSLFQVVNVFHDSALPLNDADTLAGTVAKSFALVKQLWPDSWGKKPAESKLMHGAGLRAISTLISEKLATYLPDHNGDLNDPEIWSKLSESIERLKSRIVWSDAESASASRAVQRIWRDEISGTQNTNQDIQALISFLRKETSPSIPKPRKPRRQPNDDARSRQGRTRGAGGGVCCFRYAFVTRDQREGR